MKKNKRMSICTEVKGKRERVQQLVPKLNEISIKKPKKLKECIKCKLNIEKVKFKGRNRVCEKCKVKEILDNFENGVFNKFSLAKILQNLNNEELKLLKALNPEKYKKVSMNLLKNKKVKLKEFESRESMLKAIEKKLKHIKFKLGLN